MTAHGVRSLPTTNQWSHGLGNVPYSGQLKILDLPTHVPGNNAANPQGLATNELKGFWSGFAMRGGSRDPSAEYGVLVPYFDGGAYSSLAARVDLAAFHAAADDVGRASAVKTLYLDDALVDAEEANAGDRGQRARGFGRGFAHGEYAYFVPLFDGVRAGSLVVRVHIDDFDVGCDNIKKKKLANKSQKSGCPISADAD